MLPHLAITAAAQPAPLPVIQKAPGVFSDIQRNHVGVITGTPGGVYAQLGNDLRRLLDDRVKHHLRLSVLLGAGSVSNLDDLRNLPGVSLAILQGDVLEAYAEDREQFGWLEGNIRYVARLHTEVLHIITRRDVIAGGDGTVCALKGRRVNVGGPGSGTSITVRKVLNEILGLGVTLDPAAQEAGFEQLARGQIDALAFIVGKPAPLFASDRLAQRFAEQGFEWLSAPRGLLEAGCHGARPSISAERTVYEDALLTSDDYPQLIALDRRIPSIGVPAVLAAYRFDSAASARSNATSRFITDLLDLAANPKEGLGRPDAGYNINWCGVDLAAPVRVWQRHEAAVAWIAANRAAHNRRPTRISCPPAATPRHAFCATPASINAEFSRRWQASARTEPPSDPAFMKAYNDFVQQECP
jgi:TRAP transporter TAXI family solute receptor